MDFIWSWGFPDVTDLSDTANIAHKAFNGAADHSPDVTSCEPGGQSGRKRLQWGRGSLPRCNSVADCWLSSLSCFNGAGDHSPDVTSWS